MRGLSTHGSPAVVVAFTVDPQDEAERKEERLEIIADHLGFSWTGEWNPRHGGFPRVSETIKAEDNVDLNTFQWFLNNVNINIT